MVSNDGGLSSNENTGAMPIEVFNLAEWDMGFEHVEDVLFSGLLF